MEKISLLQAEFLGASNDQLDLLIRKRVYSYEYMDSWDRFIEISLPPKEAFYNKLRAQALSDEEYAHAQNVCWTVGCKTILDYHHIDLKSMSTLLYSCISLSSSNIYITLTDTTPTHPS